MAVVLPSNYYGGDFAEHLNQGIRDAHDFAIRQAGLGIQQQELGLRGQQMGLDQQRWQAQNALEQQRIAMQGQQFGQTMALDRDKLAQQAKLNADDWNARKENWNQMALDRDARLQAQQQQWGALNQQHQDVLAETAWNHDQVNRTRHDKMIYDAHQATLARIARKRGMKEYQNPLAQQGLDDEEAEAWQTYQKSTADNPYGSHVQGGEPLQPHPLTGEVGPDNTAHTQVKQYMANSAVAQQHLDNAYQLSNDDKTDRETYFQAVKDYENASGSPLEQQLAEKRQKFQELSQEYRKLGGGTVNLHGQAKRAQEVGRDYELAKNDLMMTQRLVDARFEKNRKADASSWQKESDEYDKDIEAAQDLAAKYNNVPEIQDAVGYALPMLRKMKAGALQFKASGEVPYGQWNASVDTARDQDPNGDPKRWLAIAKTKAKSLEASKQVIKDVRKAGTELEAQDIINNTGELSQEDREHALKHTPTQQVLGRLYSQIADESRGPDGSVDRALYAQNVKMALAVLTQNPMEAAGMLNDIKNNPVFQRHIDTVRNSSTDRLSNTTGGGFSLGNAAMMALDPEMGVMAAVGETMRNGLSLNDHVTVGDSKTQGTSSSNRGADVVSAWQKMHRGQWENYKGIKADLPYMEAALRDILRGPPDQPLPGGVPNAPEAKPLNDQAQTGGFTASMPNTPSQAQETPGNGTPAPNPQAPRKTFADMYGGGVAKPEKKVGYERMESVLAEPDDDARMDTLISTFIRNPELAGATDKSPMEQAFALKASQAAKLEMEHTPYDFNTKKFTLTKRDGSTEEMEPEKLLDYLKRSYANAARAAIDANKEEHWNGVSALRMSPLEWVDWRQSDSGLTGAKQGAGGHALDYIAPDASSRLGGLRFKYPGSRQDDAYKTGAEKTGREAEDVANLVLMVLGGLQEAGVSGPNITKAGLRKATGLQAASEAGYGAETAKAGTPVKAGSMAESNKHFDDFRKLSGDLEFKQQRYADKSPGYQEASMGQDIVDAANQQTPKEANALADSRNGIGMPKDGEPVPAADAALEIRQSLARENLHDAQLRSEFPLSGGSADYEIPGEGLAPQNRAEAQKFDRLPTDEVQADRFKAMEAGAGKRFGEMQKPKIVRDKNVPAGATNPQGPRQDFKAMGDEIVARYMKEGKLPGDMHPADIGPRGQPTAQPFADVPGADAVPPPPAPPPQPAPPPSDMGGAAQSAAPVDPAKVKAFTEYVARDQAARKAAAAGAPPEVAKMQADYAAHKAALDLKYEQMLKEAAAKKADPTASAAPAKPARAPDSGSSDSGFDFSMGDSDPDLPSAAPEEDPVITKGRAEIRRWNAEEEPEAVHQAREKWARSKDAPPEVQKAMKAFDLIELKRKAESLGVPLTKEEFSTAAAKLDRESPPSDMGGAAKSAAPAPNPEHPAMMDKSTQEMYATAEKIVANLNKEGAHNFMNDARTKGFPYAIKKWWKYNPDAPKQ